MSIADKEVALQVAWSLHGTPYVWGGDDPMRGFDCSGFVVEILQSVGVLRHKTDYTAQGLLDLFSAKTVEHPHAGCLVFWSLYQNTRVHHVEFCINDNLSIGASGGGSKTIDEQAAIVQNAFIKVRPFRTRGGYLRFVDPFMESSYILANTNGRVPV